MRYERCARNADYAEQRENAYSQKFVEIEMQVASILVAAVGVAASLNRQSIWLLIIFSVAAGFLIISLIFGIVGIYVLQQFWQERMRKTNLLMDVWRTYLLDGANEASYQQIKSDAEKIAGQKPIVESPRWPHSLQTISLSLGVIVLAGTIFHLIILAVSPIM